MLRISLTKHSLMKILTKSKLFCLEPVTVEITGIHIEERNTGYVDILKAIGTGMLMYRLM